jgi:hypothetical protein
MRELTGAELLALPVRLHGVQLGRPVDLLLDRNTLRTVGLDVLCGDEVHRFLPLPTASVSDDEIAILSPLVLLEQDQLDFYRSKTFALSTLRGRPVEPKAETSALSGTSSSTLRVSSSRSWSPASESLGRASCGSLPTAAPRLNS